MSIFQINNKHKREHYLGQHEIVRVGYNTEILMRSIISDRNV